MCTRAIKGNPSTDAEIEDVRGTERACARRNSNVLGHQDDRTAGGTVGTPVGTCKGCVKGA